MADNGPTSTGTQAVQGVAAANNFPYLLNNCSTQVGDGYIQSDVKIGTGGSQNAVLLFRFNGTATVNGSNYQALLGLGTTNNVSVAYWNNGTQAFTSLATGGAAISANTWFTAKFEATGSGPVTLNLWINGTLAATGTTAFAIPTGQGGLQSNNGSTVRFDNASIVKYPPAYNVTVTDTLPAGLTYSASSGSPTVNGQQVVWSLGNLAGGANGALTVSGVVNNCGITLVNSAEANSGDPPQRRDLQQRRHDDHRRLHADPQFHRHPYGHPDTHLHAYLFPPPLRRPRRTPGPRPTAPLFYRHE